MPTLKSLRKQIEQLRLEEARLVQAAMAGSIAKVKKLMNSLGVTMEHLGASVSSAASKTVGSKPVARKARAERPGVGKAKYRNPETGETWSGYGRAPKWLADARSREEFLVGASKAPAAKKSTETTTKAASAKKAAKSSKPAAGAKAAEASAKKAVTAKKAARSAAKPAVKKPAAKKAPRASKRAAVPAKPAGEAAAPALAE